MIKSKTQASGQALSAAHFAALAAALALALSPVAQAASGAEPLSCRGSEDLAALQRYADEVDAAWNARDAAALSARYSSDATLGLERSGVRASGREEIHRYFSQSLQAVPPGVLHRTVVRRATPLGQALCLTDNAVTLVRAGADGRFETLNTFSTLTVLQRQGAAAGWDIVAVRAIALGRPAGTVEARGG